VAETRSPLRVGLLSTAAINGAILTGAAASERVTVAAVASRDGERAAAYASEHGIPRSHGGYELLLEDPEVDAVYVSLPNGLHHEWTMRALAAGKHVLCEKPYSRHPAEVEEAFDLAERNQLILMEAFMYRHHPQLARFREWLEGGAIGRLRAVAATFSFQVTGAENPRLYPELDGGVLMDAGCYPLSGVRMLAGEPTRVSAEAAIGPTGVDLSFHGLLHCPGGVIGSIEASFLGPWRQRLEAIGESGVLTLDSPWSTKGQCVVRLAVEGGTEEAIVAFSDVYRLELENLADAIAGGAEPLLGRADALGQARALDGLRRALGEGRTITLSAS
jgi:xylose dehydrogenase (NAD/NADP)